jgi:mannose-6-phosphate isomerase-like protein (cupin superfamily)
VASSRVVTIKDVQPVVPKQHYDLWSYRIVEPPSSAKLKASHVFMAPNGRADSHVHEDAEQLFIVVAGEMGLRIEDKQYRIKAGQAVLVRPGERHENFNVSSGETQYIVISTRVPSENSIRPD